MLHNLLDDWQDAGCEEPEHCRKKQRPARPLKNRDLGLEIGEPFHLVLYRIDPLAESGRRTLHGAVYLCAEVVGFLPVGLALLLLHACPFLQFRQIFPHRIDLGAHLVKPVGDYFEGDWCFLCHSFYAPFFREHELLTSILSLW